MGDKWLSDTASEVYQEVRLKVIYHPLYSLNNFVTDKSKLPQVFSHVTIWEGHIIDIIIHTI